MGHEREMVEKGFEKDRLDYWAMRDKLLAKYAGKWVAVHKGRVKAVADKPLSIMEQAVAEDGYAYTNKVDDEDKIVIRQRRVSFPYDDAYVRGQALRSRQFNIYAMFPGLPPSPDPSP